MSIEIRKSAQMMHINYVTVINLLDTVLGNPNVFLYLFSHLNIHKEIIKL